MYQKKGKNFIIFCFALHTFSKIIEGRKNESGRDESEEKRGEREGMRVRREDGRKNDSTCGRRWIEVSPKKVKESD